MLNWIFPVIVVNVDSVTTTDESKDSRGVKGEPTTTTKLSVTPDFVKRHMNCIYMFKTANSTPAPLYYFLYENGDIFVEHFITGEEVGLLLDDGTIESAD